MNWWVSRPAEIDDHSSFVRITLSHCVERRNNKGVMKRRCREMSCRSTEGKLATYIVLSCGRRRQRAAMGTKAKHRKSLVSVTKWPTKFQKVTHGRHMPHSNIQTRRNNNTKTSATEVSSGKNSTISIDETTDGRRCCIIKNWLSQLRNLKRLIVLGRKARTGTRKQNFRF